MTASFADLRVEAAERDAGDALASFRSRFYCRPGLIYLDGNSLGLASREAEAALLAAIEDWKQYGIDGWMEGERPWFTMAEDLGALQANLVGASPAEVVLAGSTTVNLHALAATFYDPSFSGSPASGRPANGSPANGSPANGSPANGSPANGSTASGSPSARTKIVANELDFPSDLYALAAQVRLRGLDPAEHLVLVPSRDGRTVSEDDLIAALDERTKLLVVPAVLYRSGQLLDIARLARAAHERGVIIGVDAAHAVGVVPLRLHEWDVDWAVWCTYKYLNGGPGSLAALFLHERHHGTVPALAGWMGSDKARQFDMAIHFTPAVGAGAFQIGTPPIFGAAALYGALQMIQEAGLDRIRAKALDQTGWLIDLIEGWLTAPPYGFMVGTPREDERRGGHVALEHPEAIQISKALKVRGIVPDFRPPNVIRLAPIALYTTYDEIWQTVQILREIVEGGEHQRLNPARATVA